MAGDRFSNVSIGPNGEADFTNALVEAKKPISGQAEASHKPQVILDAETYKDLHSISSFEQREITAYTDLTEDERVAEQAFRNEGQKEIVDVLEGSTGEEQASEWIKGAAKLLQEADTSKGNAEANPDDATLADRAKTVSRLSGKFFDKLFPDVKATDKVDYSALIPFIRDTDPRSNEGISLSEVEIAVRVSQRPKEIRAQLAESIRESIQYYADHARKLGDDNPYESVESVANGLKEIVKAQKALAALDMRISDQDGMAQARAVIGGTNESALPPIRKGPVVHEAPAAEMPETMSQEELARRRAELPPVSGTRTVSESVTPTQEQGTEQLEPIETKESEDEEMAEGIDRIQKIVDGIDDADKIKPGLQSIVDKLNSTGTGLENLVDAREFLRGWTREEEANETTEFGVPVDGAFYDIGRVLDEMIDLAESKDKKN